MITLDKSFTKNNQSNKTGQNFQMFFSLKISKLNRPLVNERGREEK